MKVYSTTSSLNSTNYSTNSIRSTDLSNASFLSILLVYTIMAASSLFVNASSSDIYLIAVIGSSTNSGKESMVQGTLLHLMLSYL